MLVDVLGTRELRVLAHVIGPALRRAVCLKSCVFLKEPGRFEKIAGTQHCALLFYNTRDLTIFLAREKLITDSVFGHEMARITHR